MDTLKCTKCGSYTEYGRGTRICSTRFCKGSMQPVESAPAVAACVDCGLTTDDKSARLYREDGKDPWRCLAGTGCAQTTMILATDSITRKETPITTGVLDYFPLALAAVARLSKKGNDKHNPGQALHWSRDKSQDHADCIPRHLIDRGTVDPDSNELHEVSLAWRALAMLELAEEQRLGKGPSRGSK